MTVVYCSFLIRQFLENVVNYLLNCIIQKNLNINEDYSQALSYDASSTIIRLMNFQKDPEQEKEKEKEKNIFSLKDYVSLNLEKNFGILITLIPNIDIFVYFLLIDQIISNIKIRPAQQLSKIHKVRCGL